MKNIRIEIAPDVWLRFEHKTDELIWCWETGEPEDITPAMQARIKEALGAIYDALYLEQMAEEIMSNVH